MSFLFVTLLLLVSYYRCACPAGKFNGGPSGSCIPWVNCSFYLQYQTAPGSSTKSPTCVLLTQCFPAQYEGTIHTYTSDAICADFTPCILGTSYELYPPTQFADRVCTPLTQCRNVGVDQYQSDFNQTFTDRQCFDITQCDFRYQYELTPPTIFSNRVCAKFSTCLATEYQVTGPTTESDRICAPVSPPCNLSTQFQVSPPNATGDRVCSTYSAACKGNLFEIVSPTPTSDRVCAASSTTLNSKFLVSYIKYDDSNCHNDVHSGSFLTTNCTVTDTDIGSNSYYGRAFCDNHSNVYVAECGSDSTCTTCTRYKFTSQQCDTNYGVKFSCVSGSQSLIVSLLFIFQFVLYLNFWC